MPRMPQRRRSWTAAVLAALAVLLMARTAAAAAADQRAPSTRAASAGIAAARSLPLGLADIARYRRIFALQDAGRLAAAEPLIAALENPRLLGHVLAQRYLQPTGNPARYDELAAWLVSYADLPEAPRIYQLALARRPAGAVTPSPPVAGFLAGSGQELREAPTMAELGLAPDWRAAIEAWRARQFAQAAAIFDEIAATPDLGAEDLAAACFWAARAGVRAQRPRRVADLLRRAAAASDGFYGLIAQRLMQQRLVFDWRKEEPEAGMFQLLLEHEAARRAIALTRVGATDLADAEIRRLAGDIGMRGIRTLTLLAQRLGLPAAQMRLAQQMRLVDGRRHDAALFPVPDWRPAGGFRVDRSLVLAIVRAESAFDAAAVSPAGAVGLMQVMPATGRLADAGLALAAGSDRSLSDPATNLAVGQAWLLRLAAAPAVGRNLIRLLVAYNAGEGRLADWLRRSPADGQDPLFFIEDIPLAQTRAYVKKVAANLWAYRARSGQPMPSLQALAENRWPVLDLSMPSSSNGSIADARADRP